MREGLGMDKFMGFHISPYLMFSIRYASVMHFHNNLCISISPKLLKEISAEKCCKGGKYDSCRSNILMCMFGGRDSGGSGIG